MNLQGKIKIEKLYGCWMSYRNPRCQITHKPTGITATVSTEGSMTKGFPVAMKLLLGKLRTPATDQRVRNYDLTPGLERIKGGGIDTTDPAVIGAIMDRGELPIEQMIKARKKDGAA